MTTDLDIPLATYESYEDDNSEQFFLDIGYRPELARTLANNVNHITLRKASPAINDFILEVKIKDSDVKPWITPVTLDEDGQGRTVHQLAGGVNGSEAMNTIVNTFKWDSAKRDLYRICEKSDGCTYHVHYTFSQGGEEMVNSRQGPTVYAQVKFRRIARTIE